MNVICICGAGTMGSGIAQVAAAAGFKTILFDIDSNVISRAREKLLGDLQTLIKKGKITEEKKADIVNKIHFTSHLDECKADLVIEAVVERPDVKVSLFSKLADINTAETIFATNTSSLSVSQIAESVPHPDRFAGLHFFNPAPVMKLVEVVKGSQTSDEVMQKLIAFTQALGKQPVVCKDSPGFIVNRVARPYYIESLSLFEKGIADLEQIDRLLENAGFRMGPFKLMDLIGNDINYAVSCSVYEQLNYPERLKPSTVQKEKVENGELGKKTGKGYYQY